MPRSSAGAALADTVAVTGAGGYLGRALLRRLSRSGVPTRAVFRSTTPESLPGVTTIQADIRDTGALAAAFSGVSAVFHLAAYAHDVRTVDDAGHQQAITFGGTVGALQAAERAS